MVLRGLNKLRKDIESTVGLPKLSDVADTLRSLPDEKKLRLLKAIINDIGRVKGSPEELALAYSLIKTIVEANMEHLQAVKEITANLVKLVRLLPKDALRQLPLGEIAEEIRKRMGEE